MSAFSIKKNKILLSDYPYRRDIENRLLLANLDQEELSFLNEILFSSIHVPLEDFNHALALSSEKIKDLIDKFAPTKLYRKEGHALIIDKEMRRYFENELRKFDPHFEPGIEYLKNMLQKIAPQQLPIWYSLPRHSEQIFPAIIEKYMANPKTYQRYIQELHFASQIPHKVMEIVFSSPELKVKASTIQRDLAITPEEFQEIMLLLEFNLACCLSHEPVEMTWEQVVTPFHEWRQYLLFLHKTQAPSIVNTSAIIRTHPDDFGFCIDLTTLLQNLKKGPLEIIKEGESWTLAETMRRIFFPCQSSADYVSRLIKRAIFMNFVKIDASQLVLAELAESWIDLKIVEKALSMTRHPIQVEKGLKRVLHSGWIFFDDFLRGFVEVFRGKDPIALVNCGKNWKYQLPEYNEDEVSLIKVTLMERLFEAGIVATGEVDGRKCFCVTPFGLSLFE